MPQSIAFEWIKAVAGIVISWPMVGLLAIFIFRKSLLDLVGQFTKGDVRRAKVGPVEIERELKDLAKEGKNAVTNLNRINQLMAESRLLELEITQNMFGTIFTAEQGDRLRKQIEEFRMLTRQSADEEIN